MTEYKTRRAQLLSQMKDHSFVIIFAGEPIRKSADSDYPFETNRNYYYLTGLNEPEGVLLLAKTGNTTQEYLFIRDIDYNLEKWIGRFISAEDARAVSGVDKVMFVSNFESFFTRGLINMEISSVGLDGDRQQFETAPLMSENFAHKLRKQYPLLELYNIYDTLAKMRLIKSDGEIQKIREAINVTNTAIEAMVQTLHPHQKEYEAVAMFMYEVLKKNGSEMFDTIAASGPNGVILHYVENNRTMEDGDLVLFDLGAKIDHYGADISRTYPVNGKFTERQAQIYNIVLEAMDVVTQATKPGTTLLALNELVKSFFVKELKKIGLISSEEELINYYYHSVSHHLGLDTHDIGQSSSVILEPGMVITNEPGLYIKEENIGIRIETDLLITEDGCEDLAPMIKKSIKDIEEMMAND